MDELKKIAPKIVLLAGMLIAMNLVYQRYLFPSDRKAYSESAELVQAVQDSAEILYLGESSNFTIADEDVDKLSISQFLAQYFPNKKLGTIAKGALHAGNYYDMLRSIPKNSPVKTVVVTMNLRSFDASWIHSKLETALQKEMVLLKPGPPLWNRLMLSLRNYEIKSLAEREAQVKAIWAKDTLRFPEPFPYRNVIEWDSAIAKRKYVKHDTLSERNDAEIDLACHYVKTFAFQIDTVTNPRIQDFDRIVALAQERGWNLILNILPENMEQAERLVGKELTWLMRQNRDLLVRRYGKQKGVTVIDQLESLHNADFRDQDWTTEHYLEHGRRNVADRIAAAIKEIYPKDYVIPKQQNRLTNHSFFNDCEGKEVWSQMQTLDAVHAHSGLSSSLTGNGKGQFGVTFTYPIPKLDSNSLDSIAFSCWVYAERQEHNAAIAWEASGDSTGYLWDSLQFRSLQQKPSEWQQIHFRIPLWPNVSSAAILKVYPYNPSPIPIWFDDIRIEFLGAGE